MFKWLIPERFPADMEQAYRADLRQRLFKQVKYAIMVGIIVTIIFIVVDLQHMDLAPDNWKIRLILTCAVIILFLYITKAPEYAIRWLDMITSFVGGYSSLGFLTLDYMYMQGFLAHKDTVDFAYLELMQAKMLEIIYVFGPLAVPLIPAIWIGLANVGITILSGGYLNVSFSVLIEVALSLSTMITMGVLFRRQFEIYSRREYVEKQEAEARRREAERMAEERSRFIRDASHNLRQPLQAIVAHNDALAIKLSRLTAGGEALMPTANRLFTSVNELRASFNKIMGLSTLYDGRATVSVGPVAIAEELHKLEALYGPSASAKGISLVVKNPRPGLSGDSDPGLLSTILGNLGRWV